MSSLPEPARLSELEAGLSALQSGQTERAIATLTQFLAAQPGEPPNALKAKMGLIKAYVQSGQTETAIALCQQLQQSQHEKAQSWATQMLVKLTPSETGFVPIGPTTQTPRRKRVQPPISHSEAVESVPVEVSTIESIPTEAPHAWRNAGRAQRWQPLPRLNPARLQWAMLGSTIALFSTLCLLAWVRQSIAWLHYNLMGRLFQRYVEMPSRDLPISGFVIGLTILCFASPWILDAILKGLYGMKSLSTAAIARHSSETHRLLQRFSQQQKIPTPKLGILPTSAPIALTYGCLPKFARIVVSQGLLDSLTEDEIAAIYAYELGHILHWDFAVMSLITVVMQIPYSIYKLGAIASDKLRKLNFDRAAISKLTEMLADLIVLISAIAYGFFWLFRWSGLWLSRARIRYSDRQACSLTGNPNGLTRALIKTAMTTAQTIQTEKRTNELIEGFELLNPVSYRSAVLLEGLFDRVSLSTLFQWEFANKNRVELQFNSSHSLISDRLLEIANYCQQWHLQPELEIETPALIKHKRKLLQFAPLIGGLTGVSIALLLWLVAQGLFAAGFFRLNWIATDYDLFSGFGLIGFGLGAIVRFNHFFPESRDVQTNLVNLLTQPDLSPSDSPVVRLEGTLIGRIGAGNQLGQDLFLQTEAGLIKLHYCSQFGAIGNLLCRFPLGQSAIVTGWFRRSATPWIDVETIKARSFLRGGHQAGSMLSAIAAILFGIAQIL